MNTRPSFFDFKKTGVIITFLVSLGPFIYAINDVVSDWAIMKYDIGYLKAQKKELDEKIARLEEITNRLGDKFERLEEVTSQLGQTSVRLSTILEEREGRRTTKKANLNSSENENPSANHSSHTLQPSPTESGVGGVE